MASAVGAEREVAELAFRSRVELARLIAVPIRNGEAQAAGS